MRDSCRGRVHSHPSLDTIVTMSGVMILEDLRDPAHFAAARQTIDTNLLGTIRVVDAFADLGGIDGRHHRD